MRIAENKTKSLTQDAVGFLGQLQKGFTFFSAQGLPSLLSVGDPNAEVALHCRQQKIQQLQQPALCSSIFCLVAHAETDCSVGLRTWTVGWAEETELSDSGVNYS